MTDALTAEQVEVIRRLRNSGATLEQIADTYKSLGITDKQLGSFGLVSKEQSKDLFQYQSPHESPTSSHQILDPPPPQESNNSACAEGIIIKSECQPSEQDSPRDSFGSITVANTLASLSDDISVDKLPWVLKEASKCYLLSLSKDSFKTLIQKCASTQPTCNFFDPMALLKNVTDEGNAETMQTFLSGEINNLDSETLTSTVDWFSNILCQADWYVKDVKDYSNNLMAGCPKSFQELPSCLVEGKFVPKRERIVYNETQLTVLDSNFQRDQYPTHHDKGRIADECNLKMAIVCGRPLLPRERVNPCNVDCWYRNKRKLCIRKSKSNSNQTPYPFTPTRPKTKIRVTPSDVYVYKISNPSTPSLSGQRQSSSPAPFHSASPFPVTIRPSVSILSRSFNSALPSPQLEHQEHSTSPTFSSEYSPSTNQEKETTMNTVPEVKLEVCSEEENAAEEEGEKEEEVEEVVDTTKELPDSEPSQMQKLPYSQDNLMLALEACKEGRASLRQASAQYGIPTSTLSVKLKGRRKFNTPVRSVLPSKEEAEIVDWLKHVSSEGYIWNKKDLLSAVKSFLDTKGRKTKWKENRPSEKWYKLFRIRHPEVIVVEATESNTSMVSEDMMTLSPGQDEGDKEKGEGQQELADHSEGPQEQLGISKKNMMMLSPGQGEGDKEKGEGQQELADHSEGHQEQLGISKKIKDEMDDS